MKSKLIDLTPLLDVVLIMVFALLIVVSENESQSRVRAEELENEIEELESENLDLQNENTKLSSELDVLKYLDEHKDEIISNQNLAYIEQYFYFIDISVNTLNNDEIIINKKNTQIYVPFELLKEELSVNQKEDKLYHYLVDEIENNGNNKHVLITINDYGYIQRASFELIKSVSNRLKKEFDFSVYVNENIIYEGEDD